MASFETAEDLAVFFDDFEMVTPVLEGAFIPFKAVFTDAYEAPQPGTRIAVSTSNPRIICRMSDVESVQRNTAIQVNGKAYITVDKQRRGEIATIYLKDA